MRWGAGSTWIAWPSGSRSPSPPAVGHPQPHSAAAGSAAAPAIWGFLRETPPLAGGRLLARRSARQRQGVHPGDAGRSLVRESSSEPVGPPRPPTFDPTGEASGVHAGGRHFVSKDPMHCRSYRRLGATGRAFDRADTWTMFLQHVSSTHVTYALYTANGAVQRSRPRSWIGRFMCFISSSRAGRRRLMHKAPSASMRTTRAGHISSLRMCGSRSWLGPGTRFVMADYGRALARRGSGSCGSAHGSCTRRCTPGHR